MPLIIVAPVLRRASLRGLPRSVPGLALRAARVEGIWTVSRLATIVVLSQGLVKMLRAELAATPAQEFGPAVNRMQLYSMAPAQVSDRARMLLVYFEKEVVPVKGHAMSPMPLLLLKKDALDLIAV